MITKKILLTFGWLAMIGLLLSIGISVVLDAHSARLAEDNFFEHGLTAQGHVTGYEWVTEHGRYAHSGDRPLVAFVAASGKQVQFRGDEYGLVPESRKPELERTIFQVTYSATNPQGARVKDWRSTSWPANYYLGSTSIGLGLLLLAILSTGKFKE